MRALVNRGRWIARCPFCSSAAYVTPADPRFFCCDCSCEQVGIAWLRVVFPDDWREIDSVLSDRPGVLTRNWSPGETLTELRVESLAGGQ